MFNDIFLPWKSMDKEEKTVIDFNRMRIDGIDWVDFILV